MKHQQDGHDKVLNRATREDCHVSPYLSHLGVFHYTHCNQRRGVGGG